MRFQVSEIKSRRCDAGYEYCKVQSKLGRQRWNICELVEIAKCVRQSWQTDRLTDWLTEKRTAQDSWTKANIKKGYRVTFEETRGKNHESLKLDRGSAIQSCIAESFSQHKIYTVQLNELQNSVRTAQWTLAVSVIQPSQLMLYRDIIAVCSQIHTKHINTLCGQNVELLNVKLVVHLVTTGL